MSNIVSTGRGGAGNIGNDPTTYTDASIVREGVPGLSDRPQYSAGRGGAANIVPSNPNSRAGTPATTGGPGKPPPTSNGKGKEPVTDDGPPVVEGGLPDAGRDRGSSFPETHTTSVQPTSSIIIPETATREVGAGYDNFHTGRGGQGNVYKEKYKGHSKPQKEVKKEEKDAEKHAEKNGHGKESLLEKAKHAVGLDRKK